MPTLTAAARVAALALGMAFGTGCNDHLPVGPDSGPQILDTGISVPVPPPSLKLEPIQHVTIEGDIGRSNPEAGTRVFLEDAFGVQGALVDPKADGSFRFTDFEIDLTMNCLELWWEEPGADGQMSVHSFFRAAIGEDDQSVVTSQFFSGCGD